jgi:hypothetical protein
MADLAALAGRGAALAFAGLTRVTGSKPLHPRGVLFDAVLHRHGPAEPLGVPWLDVTGEDDVLVRLSRGAGLPTWLPDLLGFALRVPDGAGDGPVDLLLSGAGRGPVTRQVPALHRRATATYGSLMSYRSAVGPVALAAFPEGGDVPADRAQLVAEGAGVVFTLAAAHGRGEWRPFARVELRAPAEPPDPDVHFDSMLHPPPGLRADGAMARFRRPSYAASRAVHDAHTGVLPAVAAQR